MTGPQIRAKPKPGTEAWDLYEAQVVDRQLRNKVTDLVYDMEELTHLLRKARESQIHIPLGYASWTAYAVDVFGGMNLRLSAGSRRELVALMDELDMSQRAIAAAIGVSQKTVDRDLDVIGALDPAPGPGESHDLPEEHVDPGRQDDPAPESGESPDSPPEVPGKPDTVTGLDGKTYPKRPRKPVVVITDPRPGAVVVDAEVVRPPTPAPSLSERVKAASRGRLQVPLGDEWMHDRLHLEPWGYPTKIEDYVYVVASIGRSDKTYAELDDFDLDTPLGKTLPWLIGDPDDDDDGHYGETYSQRVEREEAKAARLAKALRDALPRIEEMIALLERRANSS